MTDPGKYRDVITWKQDNSAAGDPIPSYGATLSSNLPCYIRQISGAETFRGRQLQSRVDYVVEHAYYSGIGSSLAATDRGSVTAGIYNGKTMHVEWINNLPLDAGRPGITEVFCTEQH